MGATQNGILCHWECSPGTGFNTEKQLPFGRSRSVGTQTAWRILGVLWGLATPSPMPAVHVLGLCADPDQELLGRGPSGVCSETPFFWVVLKAENHVKCT